MNVDSDNNVNMGGNRGGPRGRGRGRGGRQQRERGERRSGLKESSAIVTRVQNRGRGQRGMAARNMGRKTNSADGDSSMRDTSNTPVGNVQRWKMNREIFRGNNVDCWLAIRGHDPADTNPTELVQFLLSRLNNNPVVVLETKVEDKKILVRVENTQQALMFHKLNGERYKSRKLFINYARPSSTQEATPSYTKLLSPVISELTQRYNKESKFLNLANLGNNLNLNDVQLMRTLFKHIANKCGEVETINWAGNQIRSLAPFAHFTKFITSVVNLSFEGNNISDIEEFRNLKTIKLREVVINGNPIKNSMSQENLAMEISKRFPTLQYLDGQRMENSNYGTTLPPIKGSFYENSTTQQIAEAFLQKYFSLYDTNRGALMEAYTDSSLCSMSYSFRANRGQKVPPEEMFYSYKAASRNLIMVGDLDRRASFLHVGKLNIIRFFGTLPESKHQYDDIRIDSYVMNNIPNAQILYIAVHGHFWEKEVHRSFDRVFLLSPVAPNSSAAAAGWPAVVMNEQLHIRLYYALPPADNTTPVATTTTTTTTTTTADTNAMVEKLMGATKLKPEFAKQCLEQNAWNLEKSMEAFLQLQARGQIAPEMYMQ